MYKSILFYILALWILGQAIKWLVEDSLELGYKRGWTDGRSWRSDVIKD